MFQIVTISNDAVQYAAMRASFEQAGFTPEHASFECLDNTAENRHDPYEVLQSLAGQSRPPYVILCHQDIRLHPDCGFLQLAERIRHLDAQHPRWAVAGNAGVDPRGNVVLHLDDAHGHFRAANLPCRVHCLDENFLVLRTAAHLYPSPGLHGFHHYGVDLCLNAFLHQCEAYVIDFVLTHLSGGKSDTQEYAASGTRLERAWQHRLLVGLIRPLTLKEIIVSKFAALRRIVRNRWVYKLLWQLQLPLIAARPRRAKNLQT